MDRLRHHRASIRALLQLLYNWAIDRSIAVSTFDSGRRGRLAVIRSALQIIQLLVILADEIGVVGAALGRSCFAGRDETAHVAVAAWFGGLRLLVGDMAEEGRKNWHTADNDSDCLLGDAWVYC